MKTKTKNKNSKKKDEKGCLEIIEKKVDIEMKRLGLKNDKIDVEQFEPRRIAVSEQFILIQKISELRSLLSDSKIDDEQTIFKSEPVYNSVLDEDEKKRVKAKLWELINKF